jgi:transcriptional regulator with XRE-family HTH domain
MTPTDLKSIRTTLGWSQQRLAEELGVHPIPPMAANFYSAGSCHD